MHTWSDRGGVNKTIILAEDFSHADHEIPHAITPVLLPHEELACTQSNGKLSMYHYY